MKQKLLAIALLVVLVPGLLWALVLIGLTVAMRSEIARGRATLLSEAALTAPLIASSKALLRDEPLLADGADAAPVLNPLVHWSDSPKAEWRDTPGFEAQLKKWDTDWAAHADELDPDEATRDLGYMAGLSRFERWTFPDPGHREEPPYVRMNEFNVDAKLRLLRGLRDGKPEQAAEEVRALATLMLHAEHLRAYSMGLALLRFERRAFDALVSSGKQPPPSWQPLPRERLEALWTLYYGTMAAMSDLSPDALVTEALADLPPTLRCACEASSIEFLSGIQDSGDSELAPALARARGWLARPEGCRFDGARAHWAHPRLIQMEAFVGPDRRLSSLGGLPRPLLRPLRGTALLFDECLGAGNGYRRAREPPK